MFDPLAHLVDHATLVSEALTSHTVKTVCAMQPSTEWSDCCPDPTTHLTPPSTLYHQTVSLATPPLVIVLAALHLTVEVVFVAGSGGVHSDQFE